jgi:hypothetical protein
MFSSLRCLGLAVFYMLLASQMSQAADKSDKTGTNPINFSYDLRVYNEYQWLNTPGESRQNISTLEFRAPFANGKWQFRTRIRYTSLNVDLNNDGNDEINEDGLGEMDFRLLTVPYLDMPNRRAVAVGLETFLPTAEDRLGSQRLSFGPQVFGVLFAPLGIKNSLIAPAYQHKFSVWEENGVDALHQGLIDIFFLKTTGDKQQWALVNPQFVMDYAEGKQFGLMEVEFGTMLDKLIGTKGFSAFIRPSIQVGQDRPATGSIEGGLKAVW